MVLAVGALAQGTNAAVFLGLPAITPQLREHFDLTLPQVGLLLGAVNLGTMLTLVPWGAAADRRGERVVMTIGGAGAAVSLAMAAVDGPVVAGLALVVAGLFGASVNAASGRAVMTWFPADRRGLAMGIRQTATPLGAALTAAVLPAVAVGAGVPAAFVALAAFTGFVAVAIAVLVREPPWASRATDAKGGASLGVILKDPALIRLSAAGALLVVPQFTAAALMVELLHGHRGVAVGTAAALLAVSQVLGGLGRLGTGAWSDRTQDRITPLKTMSVAIAAGFALTAALVDQAPTPVLAVALIATAALALAWNGLALTATAELAPEGRSGTALGMQNTANYLSATITPPVASWLAATTGWPTALLLAALAAATARVLLTRTPTPTRT
ncbi:Permease, MFS-type [Saccharothrix espanaensis DSM 44229]|uniref:Permease, MFS-type n=1 Tax=Saccharothrix espanaensis (strain ATCC 51144 / DSM 44229 / JCM 9112 / NBRC 15066 / NRRL 15764) TaxID=1179773 RepID=K0K576_SACES|nr:Permease, MFS-type [Saccharothrix espanaensis DSM 44229]